MNTSELHQTIYDGLMKGDDGDSAAFIALTKLVEQYEGMKARFDSYEPGTVEGQVRAAWDLAEHHGHPEFSSKPGIVYLEEFINGLLEQLETLKAERDEGRRGSHQRQEWERRARDAKEQLEARDRAVIALRERSDREPLSVDISDYSDEFCAGFLAGQSNALDALRDASSPASGSDS